MIPGGDGFIGDLIASFLFPTIQQCIEEFACTPENIAYFAEGLGSLAGLLGGQGGGGFDFGSVNELIDLFTDCDEPPPVEPEPEEPDAIGADVQDGGAGSGDALAGDALAGDAEDDAGPAPADAVDASPADGEAETVGPDSATEEIDAGVAEEDADSDVPT